MPYDLRYIKYPKNLDRKKIKFEVRDCLGSKCAIAKCIGSNQEAEAVRHKEFDAKQEAVYELSRMFVEI